MNSNLNKFSLYIQIVRPQIRRYFKPTTNNIKNVNIISDDDDVPNSDKTRFDITSMRNKYIKRFPKIQNEILFSSKGWKRQQSKGDYFIIEPFQEKRTTLCNDMSFSDLGLENSIVDLLNKQGFTAPSEIQIKGIPTILNDNNSLLNAETGSGKTLTYVLPLIQQILNLRNLPDATETKLNHPKGLIICPNRELAEQIGRVVKSFTEPLNLNCQTIIGGYSSKLLRNPFFNKIDILVSTLGVLSKLVSFAVIKMTDCRHIIIDEADTMLDDSFNEKLVYFLNRQGFDNDSVGSSQITLVSATQPKEIDKILESVIDIESLAHITTDQLHCLMPNIRHKFLRISKENKPIELLKLLKGKKTHTIVFSNSSPTCDFISMTLNENDIPCVNLNGDMEKKIRDGQLKRFINGECHILSCTDAGSRGLDLKNVTNVINYDCPEYIADYLHRSGRTGRLSTIIKKGNPCQVTTFVSSPWQVELVQTIEQSARNMVPLPRVNANIRGIRKREFIKRENKRIEHEYY